MCSSCFHHLFTDSKLKSEQMVCPTCRCQISKKNCTRNHAVEKIISQLPTTCTYCLHIGPRCDIKHHESKTCSKRLIQCKYSLLGCDWTGSFDCLTFHVTECEYLKKIGQQLLNMIRLRKEMYDAEKKYLETALDVFSYNEININDLALKPMGIDDDDGSKLYFETSRFTAFEYEWKVRLYINDNTPEPHETVTRWLSYQLALQSRVYRMIDVKFFIIKSSYSDESISQIQPRIYHSEFNENKIESEFFKLPMSSKECNRILSLSSINF